MHTFRVGMKNRAEEESHEMNFATFIAVLALALILFWAIRYIYREKKKGVACIGCPYAGSCQKQKQGTGCNVPLFFKHFLLYVIWDVFFITEVVFDQLDYGS